MDRETIAQAAAAASLPRPNHGSSHTVAGEGFEELCSRCNSSHSVFISCFHYQVTGCLMEAHVRLSDENAEASPDTKDDEDQSPNPSLQSLLKLEHSDMATFILTRRHTEMPEIADHMASLIIMYRLLRWRMHPTSRRLASVPLFYRPTPTQLTLPHPVTIDFLAFPDLRDAMVKGDPAYPGDSSEAQMVFERDFTLNLTVQWPPLEPLVVRTSADRCSPGSPRFQLNPVFEAHCLVFENWAMRDEWIDKYPQFAGYVNKCRPSFASRPQQWAQSP